MNHPVEKDYDFPSMIERTKPETESCIDCGFCEGARLKLYKKTVILRNEKIYSTY